INIQTGEDEEAAVKLEPTKTRHSPLQYKCKYYILCGGRELVSMIICTNFNFQPSLSALCWLNLLGPSMETY
ncbi:hypothetical protein BRARA_C02150, partial [Brassica rapa]